MQYHLPVLPTDGKYQVMHTSKAVIQTRARASSIRKHDNIIFLIVKYFIMKTYQPILDRVLLQPVKQDKTQLDSGVILLENTIYDEGTVVATGPGREGEPMQLLVGDKVIHLKNKGFKLDGLVMLRQQEVEAVVEEAVNETVND